MRRVQDLFRDIFINEYECINLLYENYRFTDSIPRQPHTDWQGRGEDFLLENRRTAEVNEQGETAIVGNINAENIRPENLLTGFDFRRQERADEGDIWYSNESGFERNETPTIYES